MPPIMIFATIGISLALVFYTIGVWAEQRAGRLKGWHLIFFWLGLVCDTAATAIMINMSGGLMANVHGVTGVTAILLMIIHALWATIVWVRKDERAIVRFHKFSVVVWVIWLIPYFSGILLGSGLL